MPDSAPRPALPEGPFLVVGLARSGQAAALALAERGERVVGVDSGSPDGAARLRGSGVEIILDGDGVEEVERARCVVKSPGVPAEAQVIAAARERGLPVIGELELAWRMLPNRFCAVTGTNGKTTVAELLGHLWRTAGEPVAVAGNVGRPLASLAGRVEPATTVICEASSFQLEDAAAFRPECGVLLNVAADHLDRHPSFEDYRAAKLRLFANQTEADVAIYNGADPGLAGVEIGGRGRKVDFSSRVGELEFSLPGPHNAANAAAAAAAAAAMGIDPEPIAEGLRSFPGVAHRLERVAEIDGVLYVNDSKATNVAAAVAALRSFDGGVRAILGGSLKGAGFAELAEPVAERCVACYLIGEAADRIERELEPAWEAGVARWRSDGLAEAVRAAAAEAEPGEVVLLSPACASFDAYTDFEQRGEHFRTLVAELTTREND
ncbi:MAG: UDP-N-acetylmuramoylalanine--D-glutamate ligase [Solirubrobacterales bacterium]|jgi:UDP-N-acetylmuramoylalanine--D-glutamate ligase|nr:UDP-N-acetylmuramoylalanine--D-glutamate ligase [Solirubrobacterales bacterium]